MAGVEEDALHVLQLALAKAEGAHLAEGALHDDHQPEAAEGDRLVDYLEVHFDRLWGLGAAGGGNDGDGDLHEVLQALADVAQVEDGHVLLLVGQLEEVKYLVGQVGPVKRKWIVDAGEDDPGAPVGDRSFDFGPLLMSFCFSLSFC